MSNSSVKPELPTQNDIEEQTEPILLNFSEYFYPIDPVKPWQSTEEDDNAENQNIVNSNRFELLSTDDLEINDNMANEIREICQPVNKKNCFVCKLCYL